jgi:hypothetical protein
VRIRRRRERPFLSAAIRDAVEDDLRRRAAEILDDARRGVIVRPSPRPEPEVLHVPSQRVDLPSELS